MSDDEPRNMFAELTRLFAEREPSDAKLDQFMELIDLYAYECHGNGLEAAAKLVEAELPVIGMAGTAVSLAAEIRALKDPTP